MFYAELQVPLLSSTVLGSSDVRHHLGATFFTKGCFLLSAEYSPCVLDWHCCLRMVATHDNARFP